MRLERNTSMIKRNGQLVERKVMRFDLSAFAGFWSGFDKLKTGKGEIYASLVCSNENPNRKTDGTTPEYYLQMYPAACKRCFNLSGLRLMLNDESGAWACSGEPSRLARLRSGDANPLYAERNDGFIFLIDKDFRYIEVFVIADGRPFIDAYRKAIALGKYDTELALIRQNAEPVV